MGVAILRNYKLIEWRMKVFSESWSEAKLDRIIGTIKKMVHRHRITVVALKLHHPARRSPNIDALVTGIEKLAKNKCISLHQFSIEEIKESCLDKQAGTKKELREMLAQTYPEIMKECNRERENKRLYHTKLFEALGCARMCLSTKRESHSH